MVVTVCKVTHPGFGRAERAWWRPDWDPGHCLVGCSVNSHLQHDTFFAVITDCLYPPSVGKLEHLGLPASNPQ